jgi:DNA-binding NarL/FixJ family response regulator
MDKSAICIVAGSYANRAMVFEKLMDHCCPIIILQSIDESFYRRHLSGFQSLCLIMENKLITTEIQRVSSQYQHVLLPLLDKNETSKKMEIFVTEKDTKQTIAEKIQVLIQLPPQSQEDSQLSDREKEIVKLVAKGLTNKEIADTLFISPHTVMTHRKNISSRLGIKSISGLTVYAILKNLISIEEAQM